MFETPETKGEQSGMGMWVGILVVVALVVGGIVFYMGRKDGSPNAAPAAAASSSATPQAVADPLKDLRVVSKKMDKDYTGTTAMWSVELRNLSPVFTYSAITYETTYVAADNSVLATNHGTIPSLSLEPGESQSAQFRDALFPSGTALYSIKITGATAGR
jgi:hypothetical protein